MRLIASVNPPTLPDHRRASSRHEAARASPLSRQFVNRRAKLTPDRRPILNRDRDRAGQLAQPELLVPGIELAATDPVHPACPRRRRLRCHALRQYPKLLSSVVHWCRRSRPLERRCAPPEPSQEASGRASSRKHKETSTTKTITTTLGDLVGLAASVDADAASSHRSERADAVRILTALCARRKGVEGAECTKKTDWVFAPNIALPLAGEGAKEYPR